MGDNPKKAWLTNYLRLQRQIDHMRDLLARLENAQYLPAMPQSDGSKHTPGRSDRMANATIKYMESREKFLPKIEDKKRQMQAIEDAVYAVEDLLEQDVLRLRYLEGSDGYRLMKWRDVALAMYNNDDDADVTRVTRIHGTALLHLQMEDDLTYEDNDL